MYTKKKWENGKFYIQTIPNGEWKKKVPSIDELEEAIAANHITFAQAVAIAINIRKEIY